MIQSKSDRGPLSDAAVAQAAAEFVRKAHAVGLVDEAPDFTALTYPIVRRAVLRVREAGIGERAAAEFARTEPEDTAGLADWLRQMGAVLEDSPVPQSEWPRLLDVFGRDRLGVLLRISPASVLRYARGERRTADDVAARLHFLALVVGDLAGAYNDIGVRRWFERKRTALEGRSPAQVLRAAWQPDDPGPRAIRDLARSLVTAAAT